MKTVFLHLFLVILFVSCTDQIEKSDTDDKTELQPIASSAIELSYPSGIGTSGDTKYGLLGYGYDATGLCDTTSVKAIVFATLPDNSFVICNPNSTFPTLVYGASFDELVTKINNPNFWLVSSEASILHLKSLLEMIDKSSSIDSIYAYTYYSITYAKTHRKFFPDSDKQKYLSTIFKEDIVTLSPQELISKYGTHVITDVYTGTKFEVLYRCKLSNPTSEDAIKNLFYKRMQEFIGGTPGILESFSPTTKYFQKDENLIFNSVGSRKKMCGIINTTDYNPNNIKLDIGSIFSEENLKTQFITIGKDGILPIYELINDKIKQQEVKVYIDNYMTK